MAVRVRPLLARHASRALVSAASSSSTELLGSRGPGLMRGTFSEVRDCLAIPSPNLACRIVRIGVVFFQRVQNFRAVADSLGIASWSCAAWRSRGSIVTISIADPDGAGTKIAVDTRW